MTETATHLISNAQLGMSGIFLALFLLVFWFARKDAQQHREEVGDLSDKVLIALNKNTEGYTRLCDTIEHLEKRVN